jgi:hypothetical protein
VPLFAAFEVAPLEVASKNGHCRVRVFAHGFLFRLFGTEWVATAKKIKTDRDAARQCRGLQPRATALL